LFGRHHDADECQARHRELAQDLEIIVDAGLSQHSFNESEQRFGIGGGIATLLDALFLADRVDPDRTVAGLPDKIDRGLH
jgi:hypothetical protein